jgi:hypothetical protein
MESGQQSTALQTYETEITRAEDRLLRLLDEGILYRSAGNFVESNARLAEAARILEVRGYLSLTGELSSVITDARQTVYQGEDFEKVLVHLYMALNYLELGEDEASLVETRRVNELMAQFISEGKRPYQLNAFARYLGGLIYEKNGEINDAFIAYRASIEILDSHHQKVPAGLYLDLFRAGRRMGFHDELEKFRERVSPELWEEGRQRASNQQASLVLILESGKSPIKKSRPTRQRSGNEDLGEFLFPLAVYESRPTRVTHARLRLQSVDSETPPKESETRSLFDVEKTAEAHLQHRMGIEMSKAALRAGLRLGLAAGVGMATKSEELGILTGLLLFAATEADTRSWLLLPSDFQATRVFVPAGEYEASIQFLDAAGRVLSEESLDNLQLKKGEILFLQRRSFH